MMGLNPWLLLGVLTAGLVLFGSGVKVGSDMNEAKHMAALEAHREQVAAETARANKTATIYGQSLMASQDTAYQLRRKLNEQREQLATCLPGGGVRFTPAFVGLYNDALQTNAGNPSQPTGQADGASAFDVAETQIENGRRWYACRSQLNSLIDILEPQR
jgi:hypothetical protein